MRPLSSAWTLIPTTTAIPRPRLRGMMIARFTRLASLRAAGAVAQLVHTASCCGQRGGTRVTCPLGWEAVMRKPMRRQGAFNADLLTRAIDGLLVAVLLFLLAALVDILIAI